MKLQQSKILFSRTVKNLKISPFVPSDKLALSGFTVTKDGLLFIAVARMTFERG